jgi:hypothetical protein
MPELAPVMKTIFPASFSVNASNLSVCALRLPQPN